MARDFTRTPAGTGPYLTVAADAVLGFASPITIAAHVTVDASGTLAVIGKGGNRWLIDHNNLAPRITTVPTSQTFSGGVATAGALMHVGFVLDGASSRIYRNGVSIATGTVAAFAAANEVVYIGNRGDSLNLEHDGRMGDLGLWAAALNAREMQALAGGVSPGVVRPAALRGWWPLYGLSLPEADWKSRLQAVLARATLPAVRHTPSSPVAL